MRALETLDMDETNLDETHALLPELRLTAGIAVFELHLTQAAGKGNGHLLDLIALINQARQSFDSRMFRV